MRRYSFPFFALLLLALQALVTTAKASYDFFDPSCISTDGGTLTGTTSSTWWYGCTPTSAGMLMAYYDTNGYKGYSFSNLIPGTAPSAVNGYSAANSSFLHAIASQGHQHDFYNSGEGGLYALDSGGGGGYGEVNDDRYDGRPFDCLADFMGTSQGSRVNGGTSNYYDYNGFRVYTTDFYNHGIYDGYGLLGIERYIQYCGYEISYGFYQMCDAFLEANFPTATESGFSYADLVAELDQGRPVLLSYYGEDVGGHTMIAVGYDNSEGDVLQFYNTWDNELHSIAWLDDYYGMYVRGALVLELYTVPEPAAFALLGGLAAALAILGRRRRKAQAQA